jgi:hypothetical protein
LIAPSSSQQQLLLYSMLEDDLTKKTFRFPKFLPIKLREPPTASLSCLSSCCAACWLLRPHRVWTARPALDRPWNMAGAGAPNVRALCRRYALDHYEQASIGAAHELMDPSAPDGPLGA